MRATADKVRPFELFFDLVFVFSLIQITSSIVANETIEGVVHGLVVLCIVWWVWVTFTWVANAGAVPDSGTDWRPAFFLLAMGLVLLMGMSIPFAFWDDDLVFAYAFGGLFVVWLAAYLVQTRGFPDRRRDVLRMALPGALLPAAVIIASYAPDITTSVVVLGVGFIGGALAIAWPQRANWPLGRAHFTERYELFIIIVLGETLISIGLGATLAERTIPLIIAVLIAVGLVAILWRQYLNGVAGPGRRRLEELDDAAAVRFARVGYVVLHLVLAASIIALAAGLKVSMEDVQTPIAPLFGWVLVAGLLAFMTGVLVFRCLCTGRVAWWRLAPMAALLLVSLLAGRAPDIIFLAAATLVAALGSLPDLRLSAGQDDQAPAPAP